MDDPQAQAQGLDRRLIELIASARRRLDIAIYHLSLPSILEALERLCKRGVKVRMLLERGHPLRFAPPSCVQLKLDENERLMHHKFAIVDQRVVWTGSVNWTPNSFYFDANNAVLIEDSAVARAYEAEFDEMFSNGRYGPAKRDNNGERFGVSGVPLEVYFSPSDRPRERLLELIGSARHSIRIALYTLTDDSLFEALTAARARGVLIEALWDFLSLGDCQYSEVDELLQNGIGVLDANPGLLHHKYAIIDDAIVITGSANWSRSGMERNDENIIVIHSEEIAEHFRGNFERLLEDAQAYEADSAQPPRLEVRHFDVARDAALIEWRPHDLGVVERYEICRSNSAQDQACDRTFEAEGWAWYFIDRDVKPGEEYFYRVRSEKDGQWSAYSNVVSAQAPEDIPLLTAEEAKSSLSQLMGKTVTVRFRVTNEPKPTGAEGHLYLNAGEDYKTDFTAFIPSCALERFLGSGIDLFALKGRTVEVTGVLEEYNGPEIIVTGPWQISVFE